jgi:hypothetical protein
MRTIELQLNNFPAVPAGLVNPNNGQAVGVTNVVL